MMKRLTSLQHSASVRVEKNGHGKSFSSLDKSKRGWESGGKASVRSGRMTMVVLILVFITFYLSVMLTLCDGQVELGFKSFGSPCDGPLECNRNLWLECQEGKCTCTEPTSTVYDAVLSRCIGRVGSSCFQFGIGPYCQTNSICKLLQHPIPKINSGSLGRQSRSRTSSSANTGAHLLRETYVGICQGVLSRFGEDCDDYVSDVDVNQPVMRKCDEGMKCLRGKCDCNVNQSQYYDRRVPEEEHNGYKPSSSIASENKCLIMPGGPCHPSWKNVCGKKSVCTPTNAEKTRYSCQCDADSSSLDSSGECKINYLKSCNPQSGRGCNQDRRLECVDGVCICQHPLGQIYSLEKEKCVSLVGFKCVSTIGKGGRKLLKVSADNSSTEVAPTEFQATHCTENADCFDGSCRCKGNYFETPAGTCKEEIGYGTVCQDGQCNQFKGMACRRGQCLCLDPVMEYDEGRRACVSPIGHTCGEVAIDGLHNNHQIVSLMCSNRSRCSQTLMTGRYKCSL